MGTGVKARPGRDAGHSTPSSAEWRMSRSCTSSPSLRLKGDSGSALRFYWYLREGTWSGVRYMTGNSVIYTPAWYCSDSDIGKKKWWCLGKPSRRIWSWWYWGKLQNIRRYLRYVSRECESSEVSTASQYSVRPSSGESAHWTELSVPLKCDGRFL
jgi:hypothetical protein